MIVQSHTPVGRSRSGVVKRDNMRTSVEDVIKRADALAVMKEGGL